MSEDQERAIVRDYENSVNTTQIQTKYGIGPGTLYRILEKYGVKPRRGGKPPSRNGSDKPKTGPELIHEAVDDVLRNPKRPVAPKPEPVHQGAEGQDRKSYQVEVELEREPETTVSVEEEHTATTVDAAVPEPTGAEHLYSVTIEYRTRSVVQIKAKSIVGAAYLASQISSPTGGTTEVITLSRED